MEWRESNPSTTMAHIASSWYVEHLFNIFSWLCHFWIRFIPIWHMKIWMAWMAWNFQHRDVQPEGDQLRLGQQSRMKFTDFPVIETIETFFETIPIDTLWLKWCVEMHGMLLYHLYTAKPHRSWHVNVSQKWFRPVRRIFRASSSEMKLGTISSSREYMPHSMAQGDITITPHTHTNEKSKQSNTIQDTSKPGTQQSIMVNFCRQGNLTMPLCQPAQSQPSGDSTGLPEVLMHLPLQKILHMDPGPEF